MRMRSVSMANGLHDPQMSCRRGVQILSTFAIFQAVMPMTGWVQAHTIVELFSSFEQFIPWIALICWRLSAVKCSWRHQRAKRPIAEAERGRTLHAGRRRLHRRGLSVGFTISEYGWFMALVCSLIVAIVTFFI